VGKRVTDEPNLRRTKQVAELTKLESKIGEVTGLAMAAQAATKKVITLARSEDDGYATKLQRMHDEAAETEQRCETIAAGFDGKKTAILDEARTTKAKAAEMMSTYLDADSDALDGFEFLTMAEAGEVGHWKVLGELNKQAGNPDVQQLVNWALPIQQRHLEVVFESSASLAGSEDPNEPA
jgi:hypothetical protein